MQIPLTIKADGVHFVTKVCHGCRLQPMSHVIDMTSRSSVKYTWLITQNSYNFCLHNGSFYDVYSTII